MSAEAPVINTGIHESGPAAVPPPAGPMPALVRDVSVDENPAAPHVLSVDAEVLAVAAVGESKPEAPLFAAAAFESVRRHAKPAIDESLAKSVQPGSISPVGAVGAPAKPTFEPADKATATVVRVVLGVEEEGGCTWCRRVTEDQRALPCCGRFACMQCALDIDRSAAPTELLPACTDRQHRAVPGGLNADIFGSLPCDAARVDRAREALARASVAESEWAKAHSCGRDGCAALVAVRCMGCVGRPFVCEGCFALSHASHERDTHVSPDDRAALVTAASLPRCEEHRENTVTMLCLSCADAAARSEGDTMVPAGAAGAATLPAAPAAVAAICDACISRGAHHGHTAAPLGSVAADRRDAVRAGASAGRAAVERLSSAAADVKALTQHRGERAVALKDDIAHVQVAVQETVDSHFRALLLQLDAAERASEAAGGRVAGALQARAALISREAEALTLAADIPIMDSAQAQPCKALGAAAVFAKAAAARAACVTAPGSVSLDASTELAPEDEALSNSHLWLTHLQQSALAPLRDALRAILRLHTVSPMAAPQHAAAVLVPDTGDQLARVRVTWQPAFLPDAGCADLADAEAKTLALFADAAGRLRARLCMQVELLAPTAGAARTAAAAPLAADASTLDYAVRATRLLALGDTQVEIGCDAIGAALVSRDWRVRLTPVVCYRATHNVAADTDSLVAQAGAGGAAAQPIPCGELPMAGSLLQPCVVGPALCIALAEPAAGAPEGASAPCSAVAESSTAGAGDNDGSEATTRKDGTTLAAANGDKTAVVPECSSAAAALARGGAAAATAEVGAAEATTEYHTAAAGCVSTAAAVSALQPTTQARRAKLQLGPIGLLMAFLAGVALTVGIASWRGHTLPPAIHASPVSAGRLVTEPTATGTLVAAIDAAGGGAIVANGAWASDVPTQSAGAICQLGGCAAATLGGAALDEPTPSYAASAQATISATSERESAAASALASQSTAAASAAAAHASAQASASASASQSMAAASAAAAHASAQASAQASASASASQSMVAASAAAAQASASASNARVSASASASALQSMAAASAAAAQASASASNARVSASASASASAARGAGFVAKSRTPVGGASSQQGSRASQGADATLLWVLGAVALVLSLLLWVRGALQRPLRKIFPVCKRRGVTDTSVARTAPKASQPSRTSAVDASVRPLARPELAVAVAAAKPLAAAAAPRPAAAAAAPHPAAVAAKPLAAAAAPHPAAVAAKPLAAAAAPCPAAVAAKPLAAAAAPHPAAVAAKPLAAAAAPHPAAVAAKPLAAAAAPHPAAVAAKSLAAAAAPCPAAVAAKPLAAAAASRPAAVAATIDRVLAAVAPLPAASGVAPSEPPRAGAGVPRGTIGEFLRDVRVVGDAAISALQSWMDADPAAVADVRELPLGRRELGDAHARDLAAILPRFGRLERLYLFSNQIGDAGAAALAAALPRLARLIWMDLDSNRVGDVGATALVSAVTYLPEARHHTSLFLSSNPVTAATIAALRTRCPARLAIFT